MIGECPCPESPVGLADEVLGRQPPILPGRPQADNLTDRIEVALIAVEVRRLVSLYHPGVPGGHRIDEDEV
jgi:hypothetical protein